VLSEKEGKIMKTRVCAFSFYTLKHLELRSSHSSKPPLPVIPFGIVAFCQPRCHGPFPEKAMRARLAF